MAAERARREAENSLAQFDFTAETIRTALSSPPPFELTLSLLQRLNEIALRGVDARAGAVRTGSLHITNSEHVPPQGAAILSELEAACAYVSERWEHATAIHLASIVMWRLAWIHPFWDGNGRTSRAAGYIVLAVRLGFLPPGSSTIPDMLAKNRRGYFEALEDADAAWRGGRLNLATMERLVGRYLHQQLESSGRETQ